MISKKNIQKIKLVKDTIKDLKARQIAYQLYNRVRKTKSFSAYANGYARQSSGILCFPFTMSNNLRSVSGTTFSFLNVAVDFPHGIDWNYNERGKLWNYNLQYLNYLTQQDLSASRKVELIKDNLSWLERGKLPLEPYPVSLRIINSIKFLCQKGIRDNEIERGIYAQLSFLSTHTENHLLGNHLLENGFALAIGAFFLNSRRLYEQAKMIVLRELKEQVLGDGAHFELSPMYHNMILHRVLELLELLNYNEVFKDEEFEGFLRVMANRMLNWMVTFSYKDRSYAMVNDAAPGIAPENVVLLEYAHFLKLASPEVITLKESGYRRFNSDRFEGIIDVGVIGPYYQPGHAHADTFNVVLRIDGRDFLVDTGTSTYEPGTRRMKERSTSAHNTVTIDGENSSAVWGAFRVGRKANIIELVKGTNQIEATHDGYKKKGLYHKRKLKWGENIINIEDCVIGNGSSSECKLHLHFASGIKPEVHGCQISTSLATISFHCSSCLTILQKNYELSSGYNKTVVANKLEITFPINTKVSFTIKVI